MKKWPLGLLVVAGLLAASSYMFIPDKLIISQFVPVSAAPNGAYRVLSDQSKWPEWWPSNGVSPAVNSNRQHNFLRHNGYSYRISKKLYNAIEVTTQKENDTSISKVFILPVTADSIIIKWEDSLETGNNPFTRIAQYQYAKRVQKNMADILTCLQSYLNHVRNIYGFDIQYTSLKDTVFVATKIITPDSPSTQIIYNLIKELKTFIAAQGAEATDYPILNTTKKDKVHYETTVAIPTNKELKENKNIFIRRMIIIKDKILMTEVKGGPETVKRGFSELENFMHDHQLAAPVLPFESLVTDRSKEADTTKWITRIYYPIM